MKYQIIYADPPWDVKRGPDWNSNGPSKPLPYPTMTIGEIKALPIKELTDKNCHLYLWTINKYIKESYEVAKEWGFDVSCMLTWVKPKHGIGTWFEHKRLKHSEKPDMFRKMVVEVSGDLPRIELFAREKTEGWDVWGNEVESDIQLGVTP